MLAGALTGGCLLARAAWADGASPEAQRAPGFVYVPNDSGEAGCLPGAAAQERLLATTERALSAVGLDPDFAVVLTAGVLTCPSIFYVPVANDTLGIGYGRSGGEVTFDASPDRALSGIAFLNDLPYWLDHPDELDAAFLHELGHRFLARVHAQVSEVDVDLTGRQGEHWSYFLDSHGSPLEGNAWSEGSSPVAESPSYPRAYSPLDLYLMGAYSSEEVPPFRLLLPDETSARDCAGRPVTKVSPPQICGPLELRGSWLTVTIDDVIRAEGPRVPSFDEAPQLFRVAFLLLDPGGAGFGREACEELSNVTGRLVDRFDEATHGRLKLANVGDAGSPCDDLELAVKPDAGCSVGTPANARRAAGGLFLSLLVAAAVCLRRFGLRPG